MTQEPNKGLASRILSLGDMLVEMRGSIRELQAKIRAVYSLLAATWIVSGLSIVSAFGPTVTVVSCVIAAGVLLCLVAWCVPSMRDTRAKFIRVSTELAELCRAQGLEAQLSALSTKLHQKPRVYHPPARKLRGLGLFVFSRKTFERVFEQVLVDLEIEYFAALDEDHRLARKIIRKAPWVRIRGYWAFWTAFWMQGPLSIVKRLVRIWKIIP